MSGRQKVSGQVDGISVLDSESEDRPDLIIFQTPFAFTDDQRAPFGSVVVIDFKRPGRSYSEGDNPKKRNQVFFEKLNVPMR